MRRRFPILRVVAKLLIPYIILFALYVQFHGDYGPGGGFQAGVILAAAIICYGLVYGLQAARRVVPPAAVEIFAALGVLIYAGTGFATMILGGNFLEYGVLGHQAEDTYEIQENGQQARHEQQHEEHGEDEKAQTSDQASADDEDEHQDQHVDAHGQHVGIFVVELGVGICVAAVMISIFYAFAGRNRTV